MKKKERNAYAKKEAKITKDVITSIMDLERLEEKHRRQMNKKSLGHRKRLDDCNNKKLSSFGMPKRLV